MLRPPHGLGHTCRGRGQALSGQPQSPWSVAWHRCLRVPTTHTQHGQNAPPLPSDLPGEPQKMAKPCGSGQDPGTSALSSSPALSGSCDKSTGTTFKTRLEPGTAPHISAGTSASTREAESDPICPLLGLRSSHSGLLAVRTHTQLSAPSLAGRSLCLASPPRAEGEPSSCPGPLGVYNIIGGPDNVTNSKISLPAPPAGLSD